MTEKSIRVQIPENLVRYVMEETRYCGKYVKKRKTGYRTHHLTRVIGFYLLLKAESPGAGWINDYTKQIPTLSANFNISERSFFIYIKQMEEMQLAFREGNKIRIAGWDQLGKIFQINTHRKQTIQFNYDHTQKIHWWFAALEIKFNQESQTNAVIKKVNKNSNVEGILLEAMLKRGFEISRIKDPEYYVGRLFRLFLEDFETGTEVHDILISIRSDVNRRCETIAASWAMSPQLVSYWKKQMIKQKIIDVSKLTVMSKWTQETKECHKNKFCHVIWNGRAKERVWFLCDQITVLMPWKWQEFLKLKEAA